MASLCSSRSWLPAWSRLAGAHRSAARLTSEKFCSGFARWCPLVRCLRPWRGAGHHAAWGGGSRLLWSFSWRRLMWYRQDDHYRGGRRVHIGAGEGNPKVAHGVGKGCRAWGRKRIRLLSAPTREGSRRRPCCLLRRASTPLRKG